MTSAPVAPDADSESGDPFEVSVTRRPGVDVITARGELDVTSAVKLRNVLFDGVLCAQAAVVLDLTGVTFLDSTGIGTLVAGRRWTTSRGARFVVVCDEGPALRVLKMVKLNVVMQIWPELGPVLEALETKG